MCGRIIDKVVKEFGVVRKSEIDDTNSRVELVLQAGASGFTAPSRFFTARPPSRLDNTSSSSDLVLSSRDTITSKELFEKTIFSIVLFVIRILFLELFKKRAYRNAQCS